MNYRAARRQVVIRRIAGSIVAVVCAAFVAVGILLYVYSNMEFTGSAIAGVENTVRRLVYYLYRHTSFLRLAWDHAAVPDLGAPASRSTLAFLGWYLGFFIGASLVASANELARVVRHVDKKIEDEQKRDSANGLQIRPRVEIECQISVPKQSIWMQTRTLYVAPLVIGVILLVLMWLLT